ncbi:MAG: hypothetical protein WD875_12000 [Pirellulales bacterium]
MPTSAVAFEELEGSPTIRVSQRGAVAVREFRCAWSDWPALARLLAGDFELVGSSPTFSAPLEFPGTANLVVSEIAVEPFDGGAPEGDDVTTLLSGTNRYSVAGARVTATYRSLFDTAGAARGDLPAVPDGTFLTYEAELGTEVQSLPGRTWHWVASPSNPPLLSDQGPSLLIPSGTFHLTWQRVPLPPWDAIRQLRGAVNDASFVGSPVGTVLFLGATVERQFPFSPSGGFWEIAYTFAERTIALDGGGSVGWNYQYKETPVSGEHWVAIADDSGNPPYRSGDFSSLFEFATV